MKKLLFIVCSLLLTNVLYAQYNIKENNVWAFGYHAGLDFSSGTGVSIHTAIGGNGTSGFSAFPITSSASVCDTSGQLLFYTSGDTIWNRNNQVMPGAYNLTPMPYGTPCGNGGTAANDSEQPTFMMAANTPQGALIVPVLSNPNQYYVFSLEKLCLADEEAGRLFYSIVDMTLNNGLGGIVAGQMGIKLDSALAGQLIAIPGDNCDMWVLVHGNQNDTFKAYEITNTGINPVPVTSVTGNINGVLSYTLGMMKVSPNRRKIVTSSVGFLAVGGIGAELDDFDPATGIVSNAVMISTDPVYGECFSPDNTKLYLNDIYFFDTTIEAYVSQYDISLSTTSAIIASRVDLESAPAPQEKDMQLGPDGRIYMAGQLSGAEVGDSMDVINSPNLAGAACQLVHNAFQLTNTNADTTVNGSGMPNMYMKPLRDTVYTATDTSMTLSSGLTLQIPSGYFSYLWNDGTTDSSKAITDTGTYWVTYGNYCTYRTDTFVVRPATGIAHISGGIATLTAYPSPAKNSITVTIKGLGTINGTLQIIDAVGRTVVQQASNTSKQTIDIGNVAAGVYTIVYTGMVLPVRLQQQLVIIK